MAGAGTWTVLALMGKAGFWASTAVAVGTGLTLAIARYLRNEPVGRSAVRTRAHGKSHLGNPSRVTQNLAPAPVEQLGRPNAVSEEYNTIPRSKSGLRVQPPVPSRPPVVFPPTARPLAQPTTAPLPATPPAAMPSPVAVVLPGPVTEPKPVAEKAPAAIFVPQPEPKPEATEPEPEPQRESEPEPTAEHAPTLRSPAPFSAPSLAPSPAPFAVLARSPFPVLAPARKTLPTAPTLLPEAEPASQAVAPDSPTVASAPSSPSPADPVATEYQLPSVARLPVPTAQADSSEDEHLERAILLEQTLKSFGVEARVIDFSYGPAVTRYELQPGAGVRVNKFTALTDDLALALAAEDVRIEAPIPGKSAVGIEVPNKVRQTVPLREVLESPVFRQNPSKLAVAFGKDNAGNPVVGDLARMPHLLIAGSTGSGKSVCMNTIICSLLFKARPDEVKMLMIDPKMVELSTYNGIPHLMAPVIIDVRKAAGYLKGAVKEMEARYELFAALGVRNVQQYNQLVAVDPGPDPEHPRRPLPFIVIFIDELADLMMVAPADVEDAICRLAQMARACGMHLVIATQSPRVDVITGLIKANVPSRIAFAVSSQIDSRVIMDSAGAERLLGRGDMLYHPSGLPKPVRAQGAFIDEASVDELVRFVKAQAQPVFTAEEVAVADDRRGARAGLMDEAQPVSAAEAALPQAVRVVVEHGQASCSILQRRLRCNYSKAARLIDLMEEREFVGPHQGSRPRDVLISMAQWQEVFGNAAESTDVEE